MKELGYLIFTAKSLRLMANSMDVLNAKTIKVNVYQEENLQGLLLLALSEDSGPINLMEN